MSQAVWKSSLVAFFSQRAESLGREPGLEEVCWASGREARLWADRGRHDALIESVLALLSAGAESSILEVGSGSGYIACGLAPRVSAYVGVDLADGAVK